MVNHTNQKIKIGLYDSSITYLFCSLLQGLLFHGGRALVVSRARRRKPVPLGGEGGVQQPRFVPTRGDYPLQAFQRPSKSTATPNEFGHDVAGKATVRGQRKEGRGCMPPREGRAYNIGATANQKFIQESPEKRSVRLSYLDVK
jgi:hypothetical protein